MKGAKTDYDIFAEFAIEQGCEFHGVVGTLCSKKAVRLEEWALPKTGGFIVMAHKKTGRIGIYAFVGEDGAPLIRDIEWLKARCV